MVVTTRSALLTTVRHLLRDERPIYYFENQKDMSIYTTGCKICRYKQISIWYKM